MQRQYTLADPFRLPAKSEGSFHGQLFRQKGKWKHKWAKEHFVIQHNVLLTCTKQEPFLVKVCIPLKNIVSVELKDTGRKNEARKVFEVKYIEAARKSKEKFATILCLAASPSEAEEWIANLKKFRDRATAGPVDYVIRENVEVALRELHDALKNSGLYQLVSRLSAAVANDEMSRVRQAFWMWRQHQMNENAKEERKKFDKGLADAAEEVKVAKEAGAIVEAAAKRLARLGRFLEKLSILVNSKRHLALMALKRKTDLQYTEKTANEVQSVMISAMMVEHQISANRHVQWRKKRIIFALEMPFKRGMREAFSALKTGSYMLQKIKEMRSHAMLNLFRAKAAAERQKIEMAISKWKAISTLQQRQEDAMKALFQSRRRWDLHLALRRWNAACIIRNQRDIRACKLLDSLHQHHEHRLTR